MSAGVVAYECLVICRAALVQVASAYHEEHQLADRVCRRHARGGPDFRECPGQMCRVAAKALEAIDANVKAATGGT